MDKTEESAEAGAAAHLPEWLLSLLVCPVDRGAAQEVGIELICTTCGRKYAVRDGIPVMMPDEAEEEHTF
jgi:uncharacterized protein YbaR (Trm112 family)